MSLGRILTLWVLVGVLVIIPDGIFVTKTAPNTIRITVMVQIYKLILVFLHGPMYHLYSSSNLFILKTKINKTAGQFVFTLFVYPTPFCDKKLIVCELTRTQCFDCKPR